MPQGRLGWHASASPSYFESGYAGAWPQNSTINEVKNAQTAKDLRAKGVNLNTWSDEDMAVYRAAVQEAWTEFATNNRSQRPSQQPFGLP